MKIFTKILFWRKSLLIILAITLVPLLWIAFFNHSCADDFSYGLLSRYAWVDTHNIFAVFKAVITQIKLSYLGWQGTYSAIAVFALQPAIWGEQFYFLSTFILLTVFLYGTFSFFRASIGYIYNRNDIADIICFTVAILCIQLLPSPVQGLYWWNGSSFYVLFHSVMLIQIGHLIKIYYNESCLNSQFITGLILGAFLAGGNYISALLTTELTCLILLLCILSKKKVVRKIGGIALITLIGFFINVLAPGNAVRQSNFVSMPPVKAVLYSFHEAYIFMNAWTTPILIATLIFLLPFILKLYDKKELSKPKIQLFYVLSFLFAIFASSFTPTLYAFGSEGPGRVQNIRFFLWIIICILAEITTVHYITFYSQKAFGINYIQSIRNVCSPQMLISFFTAISITTCFFVTNYVFIGNKNTLTSISAIYSLYNGDARLYDDIAKKRMEILLSDKKEVELDLFTAKPYVLFFDDIQSNPKDWRNMDVARFYRKDMVYLKEE